MTKTHLEELKKYTLKGIEGMNRWKEVEPKIKKSHNFSQYKKAMDEFWGWHSSQTVVLLEGFLKKITK